MALPVPKIAPTTLTKAKTYPAASKMGPTSRKMAHATIDGTTSHKPLMGWELVDCDISHVELAHCTLTRCIVRASGMRGCIIKDCTLAGTSVMGSNLKNCRVSVSNLPQPPKVAHNHFDTCSVWDSTLEGAHAKTTVLSNCHLFGKKHEFTNSIVENCTSDKYFKFEDENGDIIQRRLGGSIWDREIPMLLPESVDDWTTLALPETLPTLEEEESAEMKSDKKKFFALAMQLEEAMESSARSMNEEEAARLEDAESESDDSEMED